ncbi:ATP-binding protein [Amycolatopsis acidiphila]|uniref:ATP-binding protein n=1 Tax=Amycolatopsis acidiphila TaxID=715473 RepID=A0A558A5I0_9PSEU|nr:ATP-binding protein [Amycolatopsis acidiphila]TVT19523.1 ATP-binding protein [Amycolatopsis acidiphila]UIJ56883.1 ATP-binding protein [Amycolatopsis acidiphila]GHG54584.1 anti-sigma regulatory factor [Amycolatopsis acidiphila]
MNPRHDPARPADPAFRRRGPALPRHATWLRHELDDWARARALPDPVREALALAGYEAMANAVTHAYPARTTGFLEVTACEEAGAATVVVTDHGQWRPPPPVAGALRGRGLALIHALAGRTSVDTREHGTTVTMTWPLP